MNREEFMREFERQLSGISEEERREALQYYENYFDDAGPENEEEVINELGSPRKLADEVRAELRKNFVKDSSALSEEEDIQYQEREHVLPVSYEIGTDVPQDEKGRERSKLFLIVFLCIAVAACVAVAGFIGFMRAESVANNEYTEEDFWLEEEKIWSKSEEGQLKASEIWQYGDLWNEENDYKKVYSGVRDLELKIFGIETVIQEISPQFYISNKILIDTEELPEEISEAIYVRQDEEKLSIELEERAGWSDLLKRAKGRLILLIPPIGLNEVSLKVEKASLEMENIQTNKLKVEVGVGSILIKRFDVGRIEVECGLGQVKIAGRTARAILKCDAGDIAYYASGKFSDYLFALKCGSGKIKIGDETYSGLGVEKQINNEETRMIGAEVECGTGKVEIRFQEEETESD